MTSEFEILFARPVYACYEGEESIDDPGHDLGEINEEFEKRLQAAEADLEKQRQKGVEPPRKDEQLFNQDDLNKFLAEDRRKHQEKYRKLEDGYKKLLADKNLASEARQKLEGELQDLQKAHRTKEQQVEYERKQQEEKYKKDINLYKTAAENWESRFKSTVIDRSLQDAAISADAFNPYQIVGLLRPITKMIEQADGEGNPTGEISPMIDFPDIDEKTGDKITTLRTPGEAVQRMKELPEHYGNLFRANVVSGVGTGAATGGAAPGNGGRVDPSRLSTEQYFRLRKENPEALGLKRTNDA